MSTLTSSILAASILAASLGFVALPTGSAGEGAAIAAAKDQSRLPAGLDEGLLSERIDAAFALAGAVAVDEAITHRVAAAARKADRLAAAKDCSGQAWPYIAAGCLAGMDGAGRAPTVRTVTVEYRVGDKASVLVRLPAQQIAGR
jgi:hypothetical protein